MTLEDYLKLPYAITLRRDEEDDWIADVQELKGCAAHGSTQAEALERLDDVKREWIQSALSHSLPVPLPTSEEPLPSGKWIQRVPRHLHNSLREIAKAEGTSLNQLVATVLAEYVGTARSPGRATPSTVLFLTTPVMFGGAIGSSGWAPTAAKYQPFDLEMLLQVGGRVTGGQTQATYIVEDVGASHG